MSDMGRGPGSQLIPQTFGLPSCGYATLVAQMVDQHPTSPFESALSNFTDEQLDEQERTYEADISRLNLLLAAVRATKEARRALNGSRLEPGSSYERPSMMDAVLQIMQTAPDQFWTSEQILNLLRRRQWEPQGRTPKNSVDATLSRMVAENWIIRVRRGVYALPDSEMVIAALKLGGEDQED